MHRNIHAKPAGTQGWCWVLTHRHVCSGGPPRWNAGRGLAPDQPSSESSERGVCLGRETRVTEHKVFQEKLAPGGSGNFFFLTHQYLTLMKSCRAELVFPRCIFPLLAAASPRVLGCHSPEQTHCLEGASAAHCSARLAQRMVCTMKSPLNHCSSPVPGLLFPTQEKQQLQEARNRKEVLSSSEPWPWGRRLPGWEWDCQGAQGKGR